MDRCDPVVGVAVLALVVRLVAGHQRGGRQQGPEPEHHRARERSQVRRAPVEETSRRPTSATARPHAAADGGQGDSQQRASTATVGM